MSKKIPQVSKLTMDIKHCQDYGEDHYWQLKVNRPDCMTENFYMQCVYCGFRKEISKDAARQIIGRHR